MDGKAGAPPITAPPMDAPPSYEASVGMPPGNSAAGAGHVGGFVYPKVPTQDANYGPVPNQPAAVVVPMGVPQIAMVTLTPPNFGPDTMQVFCPHCHCEVQTSTESEPGPWAWILSGLLCIVGLWPCVCIPCCISSLNTVTHRCPNCKNFLGRYKGGL